MVIFFPLLMTDFSAVTKSERISTFLVLHLRSSFESVKVYISETYQNAATYIKGIIVLYK